MWNGDGFLSFVVVQLACALFELMDGLSPYALCALTAFVLSLVCTPAAMKLARVFNIMDVPSTPLKTQRQAVPYLGGLAIFVAFAVALMSVKFFFFPYQDLAQKAWPGDLHLMRGIYAILLGGFVSLVLGLVDDARALSPGVKLLGQIAGAVLLTAVGLRIRFVENETLSIALTVFWVVAITNAVNFIDIMDGLAAGVAAIAAVGFFFFSMHGGRINNSLAAVALAGACLGFLAYNFSPARIYMGDAGSHFLGFTLAAIAINLQYSHQNMLAVFSPLLILALPIYDVMLMTVIRSRKGIRPWHGSPDHIPLRLRALGWSKQKVVLTLWASTALLAALVWKISFLNDRVALLLWAGIGLAGIGLAAWLMGIVMPQDLQPPTPPGDRA